MPFILGKEIPLFGNGYEYGDRKKHVEKALFTTPVPSPGATGQAETRRAQRGGYFLICPQSFRDKSKSSVSLCGTG